MYERVGALLIALSACALPSAPAVAQTLGPPSPAGSLACAEPNRQAMVTLAQRPEYPPSAATLGLGYASVLVLVTVDPLGRPAAVSIYRSSGNSALDESARQAALASHYLPKIVACQAVAARYLFRADFQPDEYASSGSDLPVGNRWNNPFCDASAIVVAWDKAKGAPYDGPSATYALFLWGRGTSDFNARVTLVGGEFAYSIDVPRATISKATAGVSSPSAYLISLWSVVSIDRYFVDGVGLDGGKIADCPSFVKAVEPLEDVGAEVGALPSTFTHLDAHLLQRLPPLACGEVYTRLSAAKPFTPVVGYFGDRPRSAEVEAFVDSSGQVVKTEIARSSGVDGIDAAAIAAVQYSTYKPARFLCTPVVSSGIFKVTYQP